jgi:hypothetical protein
MSHKLEQVPNFLHFSHNMPHADPAHDPINSQRKEAIPMRNAGRPHLSCGPGKRPAAPVTGARRDQ